MSGRGTAHHHTPASYLGGFSWVNNPKKRLRERPIWVAHIGAIKPFIQSAENCARITGLYDLPVDYPYPDGHIDRWPYEQYLPKVLSQLSRRVDVEGYDWIRALVPFVAGAFVRTPDANEGSNNTGRVIEFQHLLAPTMSARWTVLHFDGVETVITNDRGIGCGFFNGEHVVVVPIDPSCALILAQGTRQIIRRTKEGTWRSPIRHIAGDADDLRMINSCIARGAIAEIYGSNGRSLEQYVEPLNSRQEQSPQALIKPPEIDLNAHIYDYFRVRAALRSSKGQEQIAADRASLMEAEVPPETAIALVHTATGKTRGGVYAKSDKIVIDLDLGAYIWYLRKRNNDWSPTPISVLTAQELFKNEEFADLGTQWLRDPDTDPGFLYIRQNGSGPYGLLVDMNGAWESRKPRW